MRLTGCIFYLFLICSSVFWTPGPASAALPGMAYIDSNSLPSIAQLIIYHPYWPEQFAYRRDTGQKVGPLPFLVHEPFTDHIAVVSEKANSLTAGLVDGNWRITIPLGTFASLDIIETDRLIATSVSHEYALVDSNGRIIVEFGTYDSYGVFSCGLSAVTKDEQMGFIDREGNLKIGLSTGRPCDSGFSEGLCGYRFADGNKGFIDTDGNTKFLLQKRTDYGVGSKGFRDGLVRIEHWSDMTYDFYDKDGNVVFGGYKDAADFSEGLAGVSRKGNSKFLLNNDPNLMERNPWGFVNTKGYEEIPEQYEEVGEFSEGLAPVKKGGKWGYIDKKGHWAIPPTFSSANSFHNGVAEVYIGDNSGHTAFIDKSGKIIVTAEINRMEF